MESSSAATGMQHGTVYPLGMDLVFGCILFGSLSWLEEKPWINGCPTKHEGGSSLPDYINGEYTNHHISI